MNLGSNGSFAPSPLNAVQSEAKAYALRLTEAVAEELAGTGGTASAFCPRATCTELQGHADMANVRLLRARVMEAADAAWSS